ncbi:hypothetical protein GYMLUDRAFT_45209 [Collybiopsis luxurians FD-317 M1]|uniref:G-protein coupled receptors family 2 profile 2 domain-containing protein n=1 Tax=Collybiopsis luxurians FD-317 M1 TaxID=944289 RepID=A0A0D0BTA2_9AGAR|nr:hypothetical protein GYMLUDRAFT_45209 [Collybiopsis luxurians FD-317 M1]
MKAFVGLELSGGIGMLILPLSALLSQMHILRRINTGSTPINMIDRSRTWYSFCISWVISCFSYCFLFFAGRQFDMDHSPSFGLCFTQAALIYASPPLTGATTFALFFDLWWMFRAALNTQRFSNGKTIKIYLLVLPYGLWIVMLVGLFIAGGVSPEIVRYDLTFSPYCTMRSSIIPLLASCLTLLFAVAVLVMLVILAINLHRVRRERSRLNTSRNQKQMLPLITRIIVFVFFGTVALTISTVFVFNPEPGVKSNLALAVLPPAGVVVFGSQKDILQLWANLFTWGFRSIFPRTSRREPAQGSSQFRKNERRHEIPVALELDSINGLGSETSLMNSPYSPKRMHVGLV